MRGLDYAACARLHTRTPNAHRGTVWHALGIWRSGCTTSEFYGIGHIGLSVSCMGSHYIYIYGSTKAFGISKILLSREVANIEELKAREKHQI